MSTDGGAGTDDTAPASSDNASGRTSAGFSIETGSFIMPAYASENPQDGVKAGTLTDEIISIENVTWQSAPSYDGGTEGVYTFTPGLPEGYVLAEGASLPQITVTVDGTAALIQALLERIAALPDAQEYMEKEPGIDNWEGDEDAYEEAYTAWMEELQEYAGEALAIWEEYEALTGEQQAQMPQEALDKLTAWVEIAETLGENIVTMADDPHTCNGITFNPYTPKGHLVWNGNYYLTDSGEMTEPNGSQYMSSWITSINNLNLCLNGKKVERKNGGSIYYCIFRVQGGTLNLYDCNGSGSVSTVNTLANVVWVSQGGTFHLYGGTLQQDNSSEAAVAVTDFLENDQGGTVVVHGGSITGGSSGITVTQNLTASSVVIDGGSIDAVTNGVSVGSGTAEISGGTVKGFICGVLAENNTTVTISGGTIEGGTSGVLAKDNTTVTISGGTIIGTVRTRDNATVTIAGNATLDNPIYTAKSITASGTGVSGLSSTYEIYYSNVVNDTVVVKGSTDTTHYKLVNDGYTLVAKNGNLIAAREYSVTYNKNGGMIENESNYTSYTYRIGLTLPTPTRTGYTFEGWYENAGCTGDKVTSISTTNMGNMTYYAKWAANEYAITYEGLDGATLTARPTQHTYGTDTKVGNPMKTGYTFAGWKVNNGGTATKDLTLSGTDYMAAITLTATWTANTYTVTYDGNGNTGGSTTNSSHTYGTAKALTANGYTRSHTVTFNRNYTNGGSTTKTADYTFAGWNTQADGEGTSYSNSQSVSNLTSKNNATVTLYAKWTSASVTYTPTRTGYTFGGWYTTSDCSGSRVDSSGTYTPTATITLYAKWTRNDYTITYTLAGGALPVGKTNPTSYTVESSDFTLNNPERKGYTFAGWSGTGLTGSTNKTVTIAKGSTGERAFTANWTRNDYTIRYTLDGGALPSGKTNPTSYTVEDSAFTLNNPTKTGYTFAGWSGTGLTDNSTSVTVVKGSTGNRSYTANWTANKYTVRFDYQGAIGGNGTTRKDVTYNGTYGTLPTPEKTGYVFKGWYTQTGGKGSKITGTTTVEIISDQTLYAYWKDETAPAAPVLQDGFTLPAGWTKTQTTIPLTLSDNVAVTELWVKIDNGNYVKVSGFTGGSQTVTYSYAVSEGDHTYRFKAKDAVANESLESEAFRVMLDTGDPSFSKDPAAENVTADSADITFTPSEGGKAYWIVDPAGTPADAQTVISGAQGSTDEGGVNAVTGGTSAAIPVTGLTPGAAHKVYVVLEDAAGNLSVVKEVAFGTLPETPEITLADLKKDYENEKVKIPESFGDVEVYTDPDNLSGSKIEPDDDGFLSVKPGKPIYIRYPEKTEDGVTVTPSESVKIDIPSRPAAPPAKEVTVTDTTVTVKDASGDEEYILVEKGSLSDGAEPDWNGADADRVSEDGKFKGLDPDKEYELYVRKKATEDAFASEPAKTEVRTHVTVKEPELKGEGAGKPGNTAPKPEKPDEGGRTVTYTGTYGEEYTPVIKVGGKEIIPGAGTPDAEGSEMVWNEEDKKGEWKYVYPIPEGATEADITVEFRKRSLTGITAAPDSLTLYADDAANESAEALAAYLKEHCSVQAAYDNRTKETVREASFTTVDNFAPKGIVYLYTVSAEGKSDDITLAVTPVNAVGTAPAGIIKIQKTGGYTEEEVGAWLPTEVTVTYTGTGYTARREGRTVTWDTASLGSDFGGTLGKKTISGTVDLPAWATGEKAVSIEIEFIDRIILEDEQMRLPMPEFSYGDKKLPGAQGSVTVTDTNPSYTYLYSADGGATWITEDGLPRSDSGYIVPGEYQVKMTYRGDSYTGVKEASFTVTKKKLKLDKGTLAAEDKNYDGTTDAVLEEGGSAVISGMLEGDDVTLGGTLEAHFADKGPGRNIPVTVTGFLLEGADAGCYELGNTTLTLNATINKEDGTPPPGGNGSGSGSSGGNGSGGNGSGSGSGSSGGDNGGGNGSGGNGSGGDNGGGDNGGGNGGGNNSGTKPGGDKKPDDGNKTDGGKKPGSNNGGAGDGKKPEDGKKPGSNDGGNGDGTKPGNGTKPGAGNGTTSGSNNGDGTKPGGNSGNDNGNGNGNGGNSGGTKPGGDSAPAEGETQIVPVVIEDGRIVIDGGSIGDGNGGANGNTGSAGRDTDVSGTDGNNGGEDAANATGADTANGTGGEGEANGNGADGTKIATGNVPGMAGAGEGPQDGSGAAGPYTASTVLQVGEGAVIVKVVCEELTAGVADTVAMANAVLTTEQIKLVGGGDTIEIRVEVKDITGSITGQDQEVIESAVKSLREEQEELTLGTYVDISMFVKVGEREWNAVTRSNEPVEVVIGIPDEIREDGREYCVIRSHEGECDILADMDDASDTITISTDKFSAYAIAYALTDGTGTDGTAKCGLCHICPTVLGICCFIWLAVIATATAIVIFVAARRKKEEGQEGRR